MSAPRAARRGGGHEWEFRARFRRRAFGWKSQPAITRVKQAITEITKVAKKDPLLGAEGAVLFLERVSPALEQVDSSSGAIGTAVNDAITRLVPIIARAPADTRARHAWLWRLFEAHADDGIPYIEILTDHWGELCASQDVASEWADELLGITRMALSPDPSLRGHFHGTSACLSALYHAGRHDEILELLSGATVWDYNQWAVRALAALGRKAEALGYAEACRSPWASDRAIDAICEEILLSSGMRDEAYARYGLRANRGATYLSTFRSVVRKYPHKAAGEILADLVDTTPGDEGKWFAAAKDAGLLDVALDVASRAPCDPRTLTRAAREHAAEHPAFAVGAGLLAIHWLVQGHGYEITGADVWAAHRATLIAAERLGNVAEVQERIRTLIDAGGPGGFFVAEMLGRAPRA